MVLQIHEYRLKRQNTVVFLPGLPCSTLNGQARTSFVSKTRVEVPESPREITSSLP